MQQRSQGLVIALIVFIILSLGEGIGLYSVIKPYQDAITKAKAAAGEVETAKQSIQTLNGQLDKVKKKVGYDLLDVDKMLQEMDSDINRALANSSQIPKTYKGAIEALGRSLLEKNKETANYKSQNQEYRTLADNEIRKTRTQKEEFEQQGRNAEGAYQRLKDDTNRQLEDREGVIRNLTQKVDHIEVEAKALNEKYRVEASDAKEAAVKIAGINVSLSNKLDQLSQADFDVPDGKILYVNQDDKTVRLNIGRVEGVRVLSKFGVFPSNTLDLGMAKPKGSIEIIRILGDHESEGKILEDEMTNPVMPEDMVYTPLWQVGEKVQFALGYKLDVDGDGKSDLQLIRDLIDASGAHVALWIDEDGAVHGRMNSEITAFITTETPILDILASDQTREQAVKDKIQNSYMMLLEEARLNNVREVKLPEFLRKIHYRKTANISKYEEEGGVSLNREGAPAPAVSDTPIAPIYINKDHGTPPVSSGILSPRYKSGKSQPAKPSTGKVSDYYFRKRNP